MPNISSRLDLPNLAFSPWKNPIIPVSADKYSLCDTCNGIAIRYTDNSFFMLVGDDYKSLRRNHSVVGICNLFAAEFPYFMFKARRETPENSSVRTYASNAADWRNFAEAGSHAIYGGRVLAAVYAVPNNAVCGFGYDVLSADEYAKTHVDIATAHFPTAPSVYHQGATAFPVPGYFRFYVDIPLNVTRSQFLASVARNTDGYDDASECAEKCEEAAASVLDLIGHPNRYVATFVPFVMVSRGIRAGELYVERPSSGTLMNNLWVYKDDGIMSGGDPGPSVLVPQTRAKWKNHASITTIPFFTQYSVAGWHVGAGSGPDVSFNCYDSNAGGQGGSGTGYEMIAESYVYPSLNFGGHLTNVLGPLGYGHLYNRNLSTNVSEPISALGSYTFDDWLGQYKNAMAAERLSVLQSGPVLGGESDIEATQYRAEMIGDEVSDTAKVVDMNTAIGLDPRVLCSMYASALKGGLSLEKIAILHPGAARLLAQ